MKKLIVVLFTIITLTGLIAPKIVASKIESSLYELAILMNNTPGYTVEVQQVESSWFTTNAKLNVGFDLSVLGDIPDSAAIESLTVQVDFNAAHGPFRLGKNAGLGWLGWSAEVSGKELRTHLVWPENSPFYLIQADMGLFGGQDFEDTLQAFTLDIVADTVKFAFSGYSGEGHYNGDKLSYQSNIESFTGTSYEGDFTMNNFSVELDIDSSIQEILENGFYSSNTKLNFANINVASKEKTEKIELSDLYMTMATFLDKDNQHGNMQITYGAKKIDTSEFHGEDLVLALEVNNISGEFLKAYQAHTKALYSNHAKDTSAKTMEFMLNNLLSVLTAEPQINITRFKGTFPEGSFSSNIHTSLVGVSALPAPLENPSFWLSHVVLNGNISGDKAVVEMIASQVMKSQLQSNPQAQDMTDDELNQLTAQQVPAMLAMLTQQGMLVATETSYTSNFSLIDSKLKVNETQVPLPF